MKKRFFIILFILLSVLCLTSCKSELKHYEDMNEYCLELEYSAKDPENYKILQLTDFHLGNKDNRVKHYALIEKTIKDADADFIVVTGDLFTFATKESAIEMFEFLDSFKTPWTVTFGNHDEQCYFSIDWLTKRLNALNDSGESYCIFKDLLDDDVTGNANFAINLVDNGTLIKQFIVMDSNRYNWDEMYYDYIHEDQIEWYQRLINFTKDKFSVSNYESYLFYHIPIPEFRNAVCSVSELKGVVENSDFKDSFTEEQLSSSGGEYILGSIREKICCPDTNSGFYDVIKDLGSTKAMFVGHDHNNDFIVKYEGIYFAYGVKATDRVYYYEGLLGGLLISFNKASGEMSFNQILNNYGE